MNKPANNSDQLTATLRLGWIYAIILCVSACQQSASTEKEGTIAAENTTQVATTTEKVDPNEQYELAKQTYSENPNDPDALIWFGRRTAYLGQFEQAIEIYTQGIQLHPDDARMYRHRGHRYLSTRQYDDAIADFEKAVTLIAGKEDEIEPDGLPNSRNLPLSTLHGNIWYHLGLAYYLINDMDKALSAFSNRTVTEKYDDNIVSGGHWLYMILSRQGKTDAANAAISAVHPDMDIIENGSYHKMCLFYKGLLIESDLQADEPGSSSSDVVSYGLGNWYLYARQDTVKARAYYEDLLKNGNKYSFAYLAAEADWERIFVEE